MKNITGPPEGGYTAMLAGVEGLRPMRPTLDTVRKARAAVVKAQAALAKCAAKVCTIERAALVAAMDGVAVSRKALANAKENETAAAEAVRIETDRALIMIAGGDHDFYRAMVGAGGRKYVLDALAVAKEQLE